MSKYADYIKERDGLETYENEYGFMTYSFLPDVGAVYLAEIYVVPEKRNTAAAFRLFQRLCNIAKADGYFKVLGSVDETTVNYEYSEKLMKKLGWAFYKKVGHVTYYIGKI
jgi:GNAT superfamily N-acetyltransferase